MKKRQPVFEKDIVKIPLTKGQWAIVDREAYDSNPILQKVSWIARYSKNTGTYYAASTITLHGIIMGLPDKMTDHANKDTLDNRKINLRLCDCSQNIANQRKRKRATASSQYKGVVWNKQRKKWRATISYNHRRYHLGHFEDEISAAKAYDTAAVRIYGEFAGTNFIL